MNLIIINYYDHPSNGKSEMVCHFHFTKKSGTGTAALVAAPVDRSCSSFVDLCWMTDARRCETGRRVGQLAVAKTRQSNHNCPAARSGRTRNDEIQTNFIQFLIVELANNRDLNQVDGGGGIDLFLAEKKTQPGYTKNSGQFGLFDLRSQ